MISPHRTDALQLINRCGKGNPVFKYDGDRTARKGSRTISGKLISGRAWMDGYAGCDKADGMNCGLVEFTLINPGGLGPYSHSSVNYSLQSQGNHK